MLRRLQTLAAAAGLACLLGACAHVTAGMDVATAPAAQPDFGALGDDLPAADVIASGDAAAPVADAASARAARRVSIDMPVASLCARPAARAVVERDLPGLISRPEYMFFKHMSLRQLQAASNGRMSPAELLRVSADLRALPAEVLAPGKPRRRTLLVRMASILP